MEFLQVVITVTKERKINLFCIHCGMLGHTIERCFKIHGYPLGFKLEGKFLDQVKSQQSRTKPVINQTGLLNEQAGLTTT